MSLKYSDSGEQNLRAAVAALHSMYSDIRGSKTASGFFAFNQGVKIIERNKNMLVGAFGSRGGMICRTFPLAFCKSGKIEASTSTCGLNEEVSFELETGGGEVFFCLVRFDEFRDAVKGGRNKTIEVVFDADLLLVGDRYLMTVKDVEWSENRRVKRPQKTIIIF